MANFQLRNWRGDRIAADVKQAAGRALYMAASHILTKSTAIAPLDEGPLTQTAGISVDEEAGQATVYYVQPYAVRLHESQSMNIRRGRTNKYLEKPMIEERNKVQKIIRDELRNVLR